MFNNSFHKIWLIVQREYWTRVRKRIFILTTFLTPIGMLLLIAVPVLLSKMGQEDKHIAVSDESGYFKNTLPDQKKMYFKNEGIAIDSLKNNFKTHGYDAVLYIPKLDLAKPLGIKIYSEKPLGLMTQEYINTEVKKIVEQAKVAAAHIDASTYEQLHADLNIETVVMENEAEKKSSSGVAFGIGYISSFLIYTLLLIYGMMVMRGVMEEKTNRIIEVIISSVKPYELMLGKIIGIGAVGITQFILWGILIFVFQIAAGLFFAGDLAAIHQPTGGMNMDDKMFEINQALESLRSLNFTFIISTVIFYFLGGYLIYASLFAAIGAASGDDPGDSQALTFPVTLPIIVSIFIMMQAVNDPDGQLAFWGSMIPLSSPIVMPARLPFGVPWWQIALSATFLILGFLGTTWMAAKIYRTGILMYGKKITLKEMWKWVRY